MLLKLTAAEQKKLQAIQDSYQPERERLTADFRAADNDEEKQAIARKKQALFDGMQMEIDAFLDKAQRKRFKKIEAGGVQAIIAHAKEQAPDILKDIHRITQRDCEGLKPETIEALGVGSVKDGAFFLKANYAAQSLREELYLHLEALQDNREEVQALLESLIREVEQSPFTDGGKVTEEKGNKQVEGYRKHVLAEIVKYGMMKDKLTSHMLQETDLFQNDLDGQYTMLWQVNQAGKGAQEIVAMIALNFIEQDADGLKIKKRLGMNGKAYYEAIATSFYYHLREHRGESFYFTPEEIWRIATGQAKTHKTPSPKQLQEVVKYIDMMIRTETTLNVKDEVTKRQLSFGDDFLTDGVINTWLLKADKCTFKTEKGKLVHGYIMNAVPNDEPILYRYNRVKGNILEIPYNLLDVSGYAGNEGYTMGIRNYLLMQIKMMYTKDRNSNRILFSTLYEYTGIPTPEERAAGNEENIAGGYKDKKTRQSTVRRYRLADRDKIEAILTSFVDKEWIKGYTPIKKGATVIGVDISLDPKLIEQKKTQQ